MYWLMFRVLLVTFLPVPINPKLTRPDPKKNFWTFQCDEFKSCYQIAKLFYAEKKVV
jgi:hypothetical protein